MRPRRPLSATSRPGWCTRPAAGNEVAEVYQMGYEAGQAESSRSYANGFRAGAWLAERLAGGDDDLRRAIREMLDDGEAGDVNA